MDRIASLESLVDSIDARLGRIEGDVSSIKATLASMDAKFDISAIRSDVEKAHTDIYKWTVTILAVVAAIYFGIQRLPIQASAPAPIHAPTETEGHSNPAPASR